MLRQGEQMILTRNAPIGGQEVPVLRIWLRVAPEVPARIVAWLGAAQLRASRALCPLATLHADPARWEAFTQALAAGQGAPAPGAGEALLAGLGWPAPLEQVAAAARCTQRVFGE